MTNDMTVGDAVSSSQQSGEGMAYFWRPIQKLASHWLTLQNADGILNYC